MVVSLNGVRDENSASSAWSRFIILSMDLFTGMDGYRATTSKETCISFGPMCQFFDVSTKSREFFSIEGFLASVGWMILTRYSLSPYAAVPMVETSTRKGYSLFGLWALHCP